VASGPDGTRSCPVRAAPRAATSRDARREPHRRPRRRRPLRQDHRARGAVPRVPRARHGRRAGRRHHIHPPGRGRARGARGPRAAGVPARGRRRRRARRARAGVGTPRTGPVCPEDPEVARRALVALPEAPIGTTDTFVVRLLSEFALDAALPLPDGTAGAPRRAHRDRGRRRPPRAGPRPRAGCSTRRGPRRCARRCRRSPRTSRSTSSCRSSRAARGGTTSRSRSPTTCCSRGPSAWGRAAPPCCRWPRSWAPPTAPKPAGRRRSRSSRTCRAPGPSPAVARWAGGGLRPPPVPARAVRLARGGCTSGASPASGSARRCRPRRSPLGPGTLDLWELVHALRYPYDDPAKVQLADGLRRARAGLRAEVVSAGLREAALAGELGYDELLEAGHPPVPAGSPHGSRAGSGRCSSTRCRTPTRANTRCTGPSPPSTAWRRCSSATRGRACTCSATPSPSCSASSRRPAPTPRDLRVNRRSAPRLVEAHRALFDQLDPPMRAKRWAATGGARHARVRPGERGAGAARGPPGRPRARARRDRRRRRRPPATTTSTSARSTGSWSGCGRRRRSPGGPGRRRSCWRPTGASPSGRAPRSARGRGGSTPRSWRGATGRSGSSRVADDVRLLLRALSSEDDDLAWVGVWRHPAVGLTDGALARAVAGVGLLVHREGRLVPHREGRRSSLGRLLDADALGPPHGADDVTAFARAPAGAGGRAGRAGAATHLPGARPPVRRARPAHALGRRPRGRRRPRGAGGPPGLDPRAGFAWPTTRSRVVRALRGRARAPGRAVGAAGGPRGVHDVVPGEGPGLGPRVRAAAGAPRARAARRRGARRVDGAAGRRSGAARGAVVRPRRRPVGLQGPARAARGAPAPPPAHRGVRAVRVRRDHPRPPLGDAGPAPEGAPAEGPRGRCSSRTCSRARGWPGRSRA
jgi:hypothetical protein